jgi:integral membrane protein (TIGR01906 family)
VPAADGPAAQTPVASTAPAVGTSLDTDKDDDGEPAFSWMTRQSPVKVEQPAEGSDPEPMRPAGKLPKLPGADTVAPAAAAAAAAPAAATSAAAGAAASAKAAAPDAPFVESSPTTMLHVRPPQEEVDKRLAARDLAAKSKPVLPRVFQVLLAVFYPIVLSVLAIRLVTTSVFLWVEYHRPGFPVDSFGFSTQDRMTYGSYAVDYLLNFAPARYLGDLVFPDGKPLFTTGEVSHMHDVKSVIDLAFVVGAILAIVMIIGVVYLSRRSVGGVRRALFAGSIATLALVITFGVLGFLGWETFFTDFHELLFKNGTWTFYTNDTLIRLFPGQFWMDAGLFIGVFVFVVSSLTFAFTWPTKQRRQKVAKSKRVGRRAAAQ